MKSKLIFSLVFFIPVFSWSIHSPKNLKVDYNVNPLGIDNPIPAFSWEVGDIDRGAVQSAFQIIVSSSPELSKQNSGDVWDSKKVTSNQTIQVLYQGKPLKSATRYYWSVKTWNADDIESEFSEPSWFETGILNSNDWNATWISDGREIPQRDEDFYEKIPAPLFRKAFSIGNL